MPSAPITAHAPSAARSKPWRTRLAPVAAATCPAVQASGHARQDTAEGKQSNTDIPVGTGVARVDGSAGKVCKATNNPAFVNVPELASMAVPCLHRPVCHQHASFPRGTVSIVSTTDF